MFSPLKLKLTLMKMIKVFLGSSFQTLPGDAVRKIRGKYLIAFKM